MSADLEQAWLAETRRFWDTDSEFDARYRRILASEPFMASADPAELERLWDEHTASDMDAILQGVPLAPDWTCVEIGAGLGRLIKPMAERSGEAVGFDVSPRMVEMASRYLADVPNASVQLNDGCSLPGLSDGSVDFVYSHLAFQHFTRFEIVDGYLAEIRRVLRPGGYFRVQNWRDAARPLGESIKDIVRPLLGRARWRSSRCWTWSQGREIKYGGVTFHPRKWRSLLQRHGLDVVDLAVGVGHSYWMWTTCRRRR